MATERPRVCIVGAGAIGGFLGVHLAQTSVDVSVLARGKTLDAIRAQGWKLIGKEQTLTGSVMATDDPYSLGIQDYVFICVKAYSLPAVMPLLKPLLGPDTIVLPALNGIPWWFSHGDSRFASARLASVDPEGLIEAVVPYSNLLGTVVYPACSSPQPGVVRHHSGSQIVIGEILTSSNSQSAGRIEKAGALFKSAGLDVAITSDIRSEVWRKLLGNACFNPVSFLTGSHTDELIDDPRIYALFEGMMTETLAVGRALGLQVHVQPDERIAQTRKLGHVKTSMLQDMEAGRPVEVEAILGTLVELAQTVKLSVPLIETIYALAGRKSEVLAS
ncbi:MAG TPA: 2-dehydropantoate 2-reductase [Eoetvoesiella sp.]